MQPPDSEAYSPLARSARAERPSRLSRFTCNGRLVATPFAGRPTTHSLWHACERASSLRPRRPFTAQSRARTERLSARAASCATSFGRHSIREPDPRRWISSPFANQPASGRPLRRSSLVTRPRICDGCPSLLEPFHWLQTELTTRAPKPVCAELLACPVDASALRPR